LREGDQADLSSVVPGVVPGIHDFTAAKTWMAGTSPAMTNMEVVAWIG
jgi:hypothetical protein